MIDMKTTFETYEEYRQVRSEIQKEIQSILGDNQAFMMEVAINEGLTNALRSTRGKGPITLCVRVTQGKRLIIRIRDSGPGFNAKEMLTKISSPSDDLFQEKLEDDSGRGLVLMKHASDKMIYNRTGNELLLMKYL
ncbi:ATP-binding protein [Ammoniphilus sp. CFH 90114]|uniref:ATP-binding protein n=1 Tax=Ammoniphilus sp. CFH 90114 TaxID=2493665 RepID=UPI00100FA0B3|nr:ATP-binding protein [Ammoniphilus sp. CFH 90114]RXT06470.1 ATP-binding protein [Ammoniphilus sp. CFH 90114]